MSNSIYGKCPRCGYVCDHRYNGDQHGLPIRDDDGIKRVYIVPLYTCEQCKSTWADVDNKRPQE